MLGFEGENAREKVIVLLTMCFALAMAMLDNTVVNVALPSINENLGAGVSGLQWIVDGYVLGVRLAAAHRRHPRRQVRPQEDVPRRARDLHARVRSRAAFRRAPAARSSSRALQGVGAALLMPGTLSIITVTFPPRERAKAIGLWAGVSGLALALGPTLGGYMVEHLGWQSVFFLNLPIGIVAFLVATRTVRESRSERGALASTSPASRSARSACFSIDLRR